MTKKDRLIKSLDRACSPVRRIWPRLSEALLGLSALLVIAFCLLTFSPALSVKASKLLSGNKYLALVDGLINPFRNRHILLHSGLPIYDLKIRHREFRKIEQAIEAAKKKGWMSEDEKVWANAQFIHNGEVYNVKVRVRGDLPNHWAGPKKSWRIKFGKQTIEEDGQFRKEPRLFEHTRQINLIIPIDRRYVLSYFANLLMREQGLVVPRDDFVILRINGTIAGLYYQVEHFDKPLLAMQRRPETTIFGQDDRAMHFEQYSKYGTAVASDARYDLGATRRLITPEDNLAMRAMQVLFDHARNPTAENFRRARAVLDWEKYLRFRNLTTLFNTNHVRFGSDNLRLYFDPSRGLLEPIPWDLHVVKMPPEPGTIDYWNEHGPDALQLATLQDPDLRRQRNKLLWELIADGGESLIARYRRVHEKFRHAAWADVLATPIHGYKMDELKKTIEYNIRRTYKVLNTSNGGVLYRLDSGEQAMIELSSFCFSGIVFHELTLQDSLGLEGEYALYEDSNDNGMWDAGDALLLHATAQENTLRLPVAAFVPPAVEYGGELIDGRYWEFMDTKTGRRRYFLRGRLAGETRDPVVWQPPQIGVVASNAVTDKPVPAGVNGSEGLDPANSIGITAYDASTPFDLEAIELTRAEFLQRHPQFQRDSSRTPGGVVLRGRATLPETVIVPRGVPLVIAPGTDLTLMPGVSLVCYGGLQAAGTPEQRIAVHGDGSGKPWGTIAAVRPPEKVVLRYVDFQDGGQAVVNATLFTGGVAVYENDLEVAGCAFRNMTSEDGLNLKNGRIAMQDCVFEKNASDAIDLDFCTGDIRNSTFRDIRGDGVDLSGSQVLVSGCWFERVMDKGTSVGENSHPILVNNVYKDCAIGVSCKDLSRPRVAHCTFVGNQLAIEAKRKKPMFGPGDGEFVNCVFSGNKTLLQEDYFSKNRVLVRHSLLDVAGDWPTCKTARIRFADAEHENYLLQPGVYEGNGYRMDEPDWALPGLPQDAPRRPGVVSASIGARQ